MFSRKIDRIVRVVAGSIIMTTGLHAWAQQEFFTKDDVIKYTPDWHGERFPDGRPKVSDDILDRMKNVTLEEAWATLQGAAFVHQYDPSHHYGSLRTGRLLNSTMVSINGPTRIGHALVLPGDVVLGRNGGVIFIPPQLAEKVVKDSERTRLRDIFGHQRLEEK